MRCASWKRCRPSRTNVAAAIAKAGYVPDVMASSLTSRRTRLVGLVLHTITASIYGATGAGLTSVLSERQLLALIGDSGSAFYAEKIVAAFLGQRVVGMVLSNL